MGRGGDEKKAEVLTYDPVGNRLTGPERDDLYTYNSGNQLISDSENQYQYDRNGNLVQKTERGYYYGDTRTRSYFYDFENRLVKVIKVDDDETVTVTFKYDPFGRRIEKAVTDEDDWDTETKTTTYIYDNEGIILEFLTTAKYGRSWTETTRYTHGPGIDEPLAVERGGEVHFYHADGLGSVTALTDGWQRVVKRYGYDSFGNQTQRDDDDGDRDGDGWDRGDWDRDDDCET